jgi:hypothetical protein
LRKKLMARYYPDSASAFTSSFMAAFQPGLNSAINSYKSDREEATKRLADNWATAKATYNANQAKNSEYMKIAEDLMPSIEIPTGLDQKKMQAYLGTLVRYHSGNPLKAAAYMQNQIAAGALSTTSDLTKATGLALNSTAMRQELPEVKTQLASQTDDMLEIEKISSAPTVESTDQETASNSYELNDLSDVSKRETGFFGQVKEALFTGRTPANLMQDSLYEFKKDLEASGDLELYNKIASGEEDGSPLSGLDGVTVDFMKMAAYDKRGTGMKPPNFSTITSQEEYDATKIGLESNVFSGVTEEYLTAFYKLGTEYFSGKSMPENLPSDLNNISSHGDSVKTMAIYESLTDEQKSEVPSAWTHRLRGIISAFASLDKDGSGALSADSLFSTFNDYKSKANTPKAEEELHQFVRGGFYEGLRILNATDTQMTSQERLQRFNLADTMVTEINGNGMFDPLLAKIDTARQGVLQAESSIAQAKQAPTSQLKFVQNENGEYEATNLVRTIVDGATVYKDSSGKTVEPNKIAMMPDGHMDAKQDILTKLDNRGVSAYRSGRNQLDELFTITGQMADLVDQSVQMFTANNAPTANILNTGLVGKAVGGFEAIRQNAVGALGMLNNMREANGSDPDAQIDFSRAKSTFDALQAQIEIAENDPLTSVASLYALNEGKKVLLVYKMGVLEGQSGTAMSNKDFDRLMKAVTSTEIPAFKESIGDYAKTKFKVMKNNFNDIKNDPLVVGWENQSDGVPFWSGDTFAETGIQSPDEFYSALNADGKAGYDFFIGDRSSSVEKDAPPLDAQIRPTSSPKFKYIDGAFHRVAPKN